MLLQSLRLNNFRSYEERVFAISPTTTIIVGENAAGKSNIIESIVLLSIGKSFRAGLEKEMIREEAEVARIGASLSDKTKLEVVLTPGSVLGKKTSYKKFLINGVGKRLFTYVGLLPTVLFWPEDLRIVIGSPSARRRFLDSVLSQTNKLYRKSIQQYDKALRIRNALLQQIQEGASVSEDQMDYWETILIEQGTLIHNARKGFISFLNTTGLAVEEQLHFSAYYDHSIVSRDRFQNYYRQERGAGTTLVGPHRDDIQITKQEPGRDKKALSRFGSRGEQRLGVLWLKQAERLFLEDKLHMKPLLLLDDIFSELDDRHRRLVFDVVSSHQSIITTTDRSFVTGKQKDIAIITL